MSEFGKIGERKPIRITRIQRISSISSDLRGRRFFKEEIHKKLTPAAIVEKTSDKEKFMEPLAGIAYDNSGKAILTVGPIPNIVDSARSDSSKAGEE